ncbi:MAG: hypothetical protein IJ808_02220 [Muribaculaceae bacterium]|nr:hypothetical protein [Muribaculaceae bacterium]
MPSDPDLETIATQSPEQYITMSFLAILQRKEKRIEELEAEIKRLKEELAAVSENK